MPVLFVYGVVETSCLPISEKVKSELAQKPEKTGDTTGCGDNFSGGVLSTIAKQIINNPQNTVEITKAVALGVVSGGYACFYNGGTFREIHPGQKNELIDAYYRKYLQQTDIESRIVSK